MRSEKVRVRMTQWSGFLLVEILWLIYHFARARITSRVTALHCCCLAALHNGRTPFARIIHAHGWTFLILGMPPHVGRSVFMSGTPAALVCETPGLCVCVCVFV